MAERAEDLQLEALRAFTLLSALRARWAGALIVGCGLGPGGAALSVAGSIAGAGCLLIDPRADVCRAALRSGACDFVVNTVDEALRVLKNEIRQRRPVGVGLTLGLAEGLGELLDRGVLPEFFTAFGIVGDDASTSAAARFGEHGTLVIDMDGSLAAQSGADRLEKFTREAGLSLEAAVFGSAEELRVHDRRLLEAIPEGDVRRSWCGTAPRFFHRERPYRRLVLLTAGERERVGALQNQG